MKKIVLLPLDERPCNYRFPQKLFGHDEIKLALPNRLGDKKTPALFAEMDTFLNQECRDADGLVISMDMLLYGGLIPSRLHHRDEDTLLSRIAVLKSLKSANPQLQIYAFQVIMRCPNYSSDDEEPDYYQNYGKEIHDLGVAVHKSRLDIKDSTSVGEALERVDSACLNDYISRREINRSMNLETLKLARDGIVDALVIPQDDSAKYGYAALDQRMIREKIREFNMEDKVLMYPGADEVELTLLSRMLLSLTGQKPRVYVKYLSELSKNIIPLYEGCTLSTTVHYHILSAGCMITESLEQADIVFVLTAPAGDMEEAASQPSEKPEYCTERNLAEMSEFVKYSISQGKIVSVADNAYANGGDLCIINLLNKNGLLMQLDGYAGWNTSANTIGTAIAEAVDVYLHGNTKAHKDFLTERYMEDAGYCSVVRKAVTAHLPKGMDYFNVCEAEGKAAGLVKNALVEFKESYLSSISKAIHLTHVALPWRRMFEVDLDAEYQEGESSAGLT